MKFSTVSRAALLAAGFGLAACGGGGGGGGSASPPPPPPPPPANSAPTSRITTPTFIIDERQTVTLDGSTSSDPEGDALTYLWRQTSGTDVGIDGATTPQVSVSIPDLSADFDFVIELEVSDGSLTDTQSQPFTANDIVRDPISQQWDGVYATLPSAGPVLALYSGGGTFEGSSDSIDGTQVTPIYSLLADGAGIALRRQGLLADGSVFDDDAFGIPGITTGAAPFDLVFNYFSSDASADFAISALGDAAVRIFKAAASENVDTFDFSEAGSFDLSGLCGLASANVGPPPTVVQNEYPGLIAGTEGNGLVALVNAGNPREQLPGELPSPAEQAAAGTFTNQRTLLTAGSYCSPASAGDTGEFFAYDPQRTEVVLISDLGEPTATVEASLTLNPSPSNDPYTLVGAAAGFGVAGQPFYGVLLSDGQHHGNHELFMVQRSSTGLISERISLPFGVPSDLVVANIDYLDAAFTDTDADILIASPDTPYVYVIETLSDFTSNPVDFSIILYFETGFGVSKATVGDVDERFGNELIVAEEDGTITVYQNSER